MSDPEIPSSPPPTPPPIPLGLDLREWEEYCFSAPIIFELIATAWRTLRQYFYRNKNLYRFQDAKAVISDFRYRSVTKLTLIPAASGKPLPAIGRNWFILAQLPSGGIHARVFDLEGAMILDTPLPVSPDSRPLLETLDSLWLDDRILSEDQADILYGIHALTGVPVPGAFHKAVAELDLTFTPEQRKHFILRALTYEVHAWRKRDAKNRWISLDEIIGGDQEDDKGRDRHSLLEDERSLPGFVRTMRRERAHLVARALDDLPFRSRETVLLALDEMECKSVHPAKLDQERQRSHTALSDFSALIASHEHAESRAGRTLISVISRSLLPNLSDQQFAVDHFCHGLSVQRMSSHSGQAESIRRRIVRAARTLQPALDQRRADAVRMLPRAMSRDIQLLLDYGGKPTLELAKQFRCAPKDLDYAIRPILADMAMAFDVLIKRSSPTGRRALEKKIEKSLTGNHREIAITFLLRRRSIWLASRLLGLTEEQGRELLYASLLAICGRQRSRILNPPQS